MPAPVAISGNNRASGLWATAFSRVLGCRLFGCFRTPRVAMRASSPFTPSIVRLTRPVDPDCFGTFRKPSVSPECQLPRLVFEVVRFFPDTLRGVAASQLRKKQTRCHSSALRNGSGVSGLSPALRLRSERSLSPPGCAWLFSGSSYFRMFPYPPRKPPY